MPTVSCLLLDEVDFGLRICQKVALYFVLEFRLNSSSNETSEIREQIERLLTISLGCINVCLSKIPLGGLCFCGDWAVFPLRPWRF